MKKLVCLGFMALVLGAQAQNDPPTNVWASAEVNCSQTTPCQGSWSWVANGSETICCPGSQPSCVAASCVLGPWIPTQCFMA